MSSRSGPRQKRRRVRLVVVAPLASIALLSACGGSAHPSAQAPAPPKGPLTLHVYATVGTPLAGATVVVRNADGKEVATGVTDEDGYSAFTVPEYSPELQLTTSGGQITGQRDDRRGRAATATLAGVISTPTADQNVYLNAVSTLAARFMKVSPKTGARDALARATRALGLPADANTGVGMSVPGGVFTGRDFVQTALLHGGVDAYLDGLANAMRSSQQPLASFADPSTETEEKAVTLAGGIGQFAYELTPGNLGKAIRDGIELFAGGPTPDEQISDRLIALSNQLSELQVSVTTGVSEIKEGVDRNRYQADLNNLETLSGKVATATEAYSDRIHDAGGEHPDAERIKQDDRAFDTAVGEIKSSYHAGPTSDWVYQNGLVDQTKLGGNSALHDLSELLAAETKPFFTHRDSEILQNLGDYIYANQAAGLMMIATYESSSKAGKEDFRSNFLKPFLGEKSKVKAWLPRLTWLRESSEENPIPIPSTPQVELPAPPAPSVLGSELQITNEIHSVPAGIVVDTRSYPGATAYHLMWLANPQRTAFTSGCTMTCVGPPCMPELGQNPLPQQDRAQPYQYPPESGGEGTQGAKVMCATLLPLYMGTTAVLHEETRGLAGRWRLPSVAEGESLIQGWNHGGESTPANWLSTHGGFALGGAWAVGTPTIQQGDVAWFLDNEGEYSAQQDPQCTGGQCGGANQCYIGASPWIRDEKCTIYEDFAYRFEQTFIDVGAASPEDTGADVASGSTYSCTATVLYAGHVNNACPAQVPAVRELHAGEHYWYPEGT